jgi:uncharacterized protein DUF2867
VKAIEVKPEVDTGAILPGAQFIDAWCIVVDGTSLGARHAAEKMFLRGPRWVESLTRLRNRLVRPFGLKTPAPGMSAASGTIGIFPVVSETPDRLVVGFNDSHLDFRVVVDVAAEGRGQRVTATTLVLTHNLPGRIYLSIIMPFHRLIARTMVLQVAG